MPARPKFKRQFAICIRTDDPDVLTPRRVYEVLPDKNAALARCPACGGGPMRVLAVLAPQGDHPP